MDDDEHKLQKLFTISQEGEDLIWHGTIERLKKSMFWGDPDIEITEWVKSKKIQELNETSEH